MPIRCGSTVATKAYCGTNEIVRGYCGEDLFFGWFEPTQTTATVTSLSRSGSISTRLGQAMAGSITNGIIFGGFGGAGELRDFYRYSVASNAATVTNLSVTGSIAPSRYVGIVGDATSGAIFGGYNGSINLGNFYKYSVASNRVTVTAFAQTTISPRHAPSMVGNLASGLIFGGKGTSLFNDFYRYTTGSNSVSITTLTLAGDTIAPRNGAGMVGDTTSGIIFGGSAELSTPGTDGANNDFFKYVVDSDTVTITKLTKVGDSIPARNYMGMTGDVNSGLIFSGYSGTAYLSDRLFYLVTGDNIYVKLLTNAGASITSRNAFGMVGDATTALVFGGNSSSGVLNDFKRIEVT